MAVSISKVRRWTALAAMLALASVVLAACGGGGSDDKSSGGGDGASTTLEETAQESGGLSFSKSDLTAKAGSVTISLDNPSGNGMPHAIEIEGNGIEQETPTADPGGSASVTVDLRPGTYTFYCPVGQHRQAGMEGTLTVS